MNIRSWQIYFSSELSYVYVYIYDYDMLHDYDNLMFVRTIIGVQRGYSIWLVGILHDMADFDPLWKPRPQPTHGMPKGFEPADIEWFLVAIPADIDCGWLFQFN